MLLNNIEERYEKIFPFIQSLCLEFYAYQEENTTSISIISIDWEQYVYDKFSFFLLKNFPEDGLIIEDFKEKVSTSSYIWLCDPLDGTSNMSTGVSFFAMIFSLVSKGTEICLSFTVDILQKTIYISYFKENFSYSLDKKQQISLKPTHTPTRDYVLLGKIFGHTSLENLNEIQSSWWSLASGSKSYRQLGAIGLQMILDGWKRDIIVVSLQVRWFDVVAAIHFLENLQYEYQISENRECLLLYHKDFKSLQPLQDLISVTKKKWNFFPLNTLDIRR